MTALSANEIVELIREYARLNMDECGAAIIADPVLHGHKITAATIATSDSLQLHSTIHSSKYHAARDILVLLGEDVSNL